MRLSDFGVALACGAGLWACAAEPEAAPEELAASVTPHMVDFTATEYAFQAPDTIAAGWTTFRMANHGAELHYGHIVRLDAGRTVEELVAAYAEAIRTSGPRPSWVTRFGGPGGAAPGGTAVVTQFLEPGTYVWICPIEDTEGNPHFGKGEFKQFVVQGGDAATMDPARGPTAALTVRLTDFSFEVEPALPSGQHTIRVENTGAEPHDFVLLKLVQGRTLEDLQQVFNPERARRDNSDEPPPALESIGYPAGGIAAIHPGMQVFFDADLTPGDYVMMCMATAPDGRSHIEHGMIQQIRVP
jgi:hypothetical protein